MHESIHEPQNRVMTHLPVAAIRRFMEERLRGARTKDDYILTYRCFVLQKSLKVSVDYLYTLIKINDREYRPKQRNDIDRYRPAYRSRFSFTLIERRRFYTAVQIFKSIHQISPPYFHKLFQFSRDVTGHVSRNFNRLFVPRVSTNFGKRSFYYRGAVLWNSLPSIVSEAATVPSFKTLYFNSD